MFNTDPMVRGGALTTCVFGLKSKKTRTSLSTGDGFPAMMAIFTSGGGDVYSERGELRALNLESCLP
jgi:hypothetical protein